MTVYRTCHNCALAKLPCARRDSIQTDIKGLGITSLKFTCADRKPLFTPGQRVATAWTTTEGGSEYVEYTLETWPATIIRESGARFLCVVDDVPSDYETPARDYFKNASLYVRASASRITPLDEPKRELCPVCDGTRGEDGRFVGCHGFENYRPQKCANSPNG